MPPDPSDIKLLEALLGFTPNNTWNSIPVGDAVHYHREELLRILYPMEHAKLECIQGYTASDVYNTLIHLLTTAEYLPSIKQIPKRSLLQFSDFTEIDNTTRTLIMPGSTFIKKKLKYISFDGSDKGMKDYTRVLFVESTEQYKGYAIPFMLVGDGNEVFQSPQMFNINNNKVSWTIKIV